MTQIDAVEINFDGLVGPTHNYSGLAFGNVASMEHAHSISNPKAAALQGLDKMVLLMRLGIVQGFIPPQERPFVPLFRSLGYEGKDPEIIRQVWKENPKLLIAGSSASSMWAANSATISPSADSQDRKVHITPANMVNNLHRAFEATFTALMLKKVFPNPSIFIHHSPLPSQAQFSDEGAANHTRFCKSYGAKGIQLFVYGRDSSLISSKRFPARQSIEASQAIARLHRIPSEQLIFAQQSPDAIDSGVFHNDVISVGNQNVFFYHENAFLNTENVIETLQSKMQAICHTDLHLIRVKQDEIPLAEAVKTYLFNSQLVTLSNGTMVLIAPIECEESSTVSAFLKNLISTDSHPIKKLIFRDVRQSMRNGGGPACLRLRVVLNSDEYSEVNPVFLLTEERAELLKVWINKHYRDRMLPEDLADPQLLQESQVALDDLSKMLELGSIYPFQIT